MSNEFDVIRRPVDHMTGNSPSVDEKHSVTVIARISPVKRVWPKN